MPRTRTTKIDLVLTGRIQAAEAEVTRLTAELGAAKALALELVHVREAFAKARERTTKSAAAKPRRAAEPVTN